MASKPKYFTIKFNGEEMVVFYPQYKEDDEWVIVSKEKPFPVELTEHNNSEITDLLKSIQESQKETKEQSELLAELISEMEKLATGPQGEPFRYEDFTEEQLEGLRGPKGDPFKFDDFTDEQLESFTNTAKEEISEEIVEHTERTNNPHNVTKSQIGLSNVDNVNQASKTDFNEHKSESSGKHVKEGDGGKSYIRFDDGTQICHVHTVLTYGTSRTLNSGGDVSFTESFAEVPHVIGSIDTREEERNNFALEELAEPYIYSVTETSFRVGIKVFKGSSGSFSSGDELGFNVMAIGRWK